MVELRVRMSTKGQIVIPKIFRENYKLYPEQNLIMKEDKGKIVIEKQEEDIVGKLRETAKEVAKKRKGRKFEYNKMEFYEQYEERARRAGIRI